MCAKYHTKNKGYIISLYAMANKVDIQNFLPSEIFFKWCFVLEILKNSNGFLIWEILKNQSTMCPKYLILNKSCGKNSTCPDKLYGYNELFVMFFFSTKCFFICGFSKNFFMDFWYWKFLKNLITKFVKYFALHFWSKYLRFSITPPRFARRG